MSENLLQLIAGLKLLLVVGFAMLYGMGGISGKWKRRFIAPVLLGAGIWGLTTWTQSFNWVLLLCVPLFFGALSIGYGASDLKDKLIKRSRAGLACGVASLPIFWVHEAWALLLAHIVVCVAVSVAAGVWNQTQSARAEETLIGASYVLIPMLTI
jgi:hypothetical protein